jgi:hypothetical protein
MNNQGMNFNWLWVYGLGAFIGLLAAEVIEKIAKAIWGRIGKRRRKLSPKIQRGNLTLIKTSQTKINSQTN